MELTQQQYKKIEDSLPLQRGNVRLSNLEVLNAILYVAEQGCKWRGLPSRFSNWHTIYVRMNRWAKSGVLDRVLEKLQVEQIVRIKIEAFALDSTSVKVHPDGTGALKKPPEAIGKSRGGWNTEIHMVAANAPTAITFALSPGNAHDARRVGRCSRSWARCRKSSACGWIVPSKQLSLRPACSSEKDRTINPHLERWYAALAGSHTLEVAGDSHSIYVSRSQGEKVRTHLETKDFRSQQ
jgi:transposase